jgi:hypothetical protein
VGFDVTDQLLARFSSFVRYWKKNLECNETVHQLFIDLKKAHDSMRRGVTYNILIEFGLPMKPVRLIKMCLNQTYSKVIIGKHSLSPLLFNFALEYAIKKVQEIRWD